VRFLCSFFDSPISFTAEFLIAKNAKFQESTKREHVCHFVISIRMLGEKFLSFYYSKQFQTQAQYCNPSHADTSYILRTNWLNCCKKLAAEGLDWTKQNDGRTYWKILIWRMWVSHFKNHSSPCNTQIYIPASQPVPRFIAVLISFKRWIHLH
jgi:hypothetical protein